MLRVLALSVLFIGEVNGFVPNTIVHSAFKDQSIAVTMVATAGDEKLLKVTNPFDSPSIRRLQKDPKDYGNAFDSPSIRVNGGNSDRTTFNL
jgi:hypothetical protein